MAPQKGLMSSKNLLKKDQLPLQFKTKLMILFRLQVRRVSKVFDFTFKYFWRLRNSIEFSYLKFIQIKSQAQQSNRFEILEFVTWYTVDLL